MDNTPEGLLKFIKQKLEESYTSNQIKECLIKNKIDEEQIELLLKSALREEVKPRRINKYKILLLVLIPLIITLVCSPFLFKQGTTIITKTQQTITMDKEEECFRLLSEIGKQYFNIQTWPTYEEFTMNAVTNTSYRDFFNRRSKTSPEPVSIWKSYTFGTQTSLHVQDIPSPVKNHIIHLDYGFNNNKLEACVASKTIPEGKYDFANLDGFDISGFKNISYDVQSIQTSIGTLNVHLYNKLYFNKREEKMFSSSMVILELKDADKPFEKENSSPGFQTLLLKNKAIKSALLCLIFLLSIAAMYALNRFYLKLF